MVRERVKGGIFSYAALHYQYSIILITVFSLHHITFFAGVNLEKGSFAVSPDILDLHRKIALTLYPCTKGLRPLYSPRISSMN